MKAPNPTGKPPRRTCLGIALAAGEGVRMRSARPKALHEIAGRAMLAHALDALAGAGANAIAVVVGPNRDDVAAEAREMRAGGGSLRAERTQGHRPCGARGARGDRARLRRRPRHLRRHSADLGANAGAPCAKASPTAPGSSFSASSRPTRPATAG